MTAGLPDDLAQAIRAERSATVDKLGREPTLWLAAAPLWTKDAAEATGFPAVSVAEFVTQAQDVGWCESRGSRRSQGSGELQFWIPDEARREVINILSEREGADRLRREVKGIAERMTSTGTTLPTTLRDWAELMCEASPEKALIDRVRQAVGADALGHAQQLVVVGEALAPLLAGAAELAVDRARRLMNLGARRRHDGRALGRYLDRPSLSDAVTRLLDPDPEAREWALHLRGVGGVGKTMLVRYLASGRYAAERGRAIIPIARADFDHIRPDYPVRRPVQLLLELADELALHTAAITGSDRALSSFRATATSAHEALSGLREESGPPLQHPLVLRAIDDFAQAIDRLPGVVLLILDTCEELAKADAGNPAAPAVEATLGIIERLHDQASSTRVLLAGRRPLPARPYLTVEEVTGFTVDEAREYLDTLSARPLARDLRDALIRLSPAVDGELPSEGNLPERVSPFDLALFLLWAEEDPGLDMRRIEVAGRDAYVEGRIIGRLDDPVVLKALPVVALLGRCRVSTLASVAGDGVVSAAALAARLAEQEWIDADADPPTRLTVKPGLVPGLQRYFSAPPRRAEFTATVAQLAKVLRQAVRTLPLADIDVDELLAALRWSEPAEAAGLWDDIAERAEASPGRWGWILNVARRVLGESEEEQWPTARALRATVTASYLAARRRADTSLNPRSTWVDVREWADCHPSEASGRILRARAALGLLPYTPDDPSAWEDVQSVIPSPALAAAAVDTADRLLEAGASGAVVRLLRTGHLRGALDGEAGSRVQAWGRVVLGRLWADEDRREARYALADAEAAAATAGAEPAWADWVPPADLLARVRLELGLLCAVDAFAVAELPLDEWEGYAAGDLSNVDRERLASLCLRLRLDGGTIERAELDHWEQIDGYSPGRAPTCSAHDLVPPLFVTLAEAEVPAGRPERALALIRQRRADALDRRDRRADDSTLRLADAATVRLVRRLRLDDERHTLTRLSSGDYSDPSGLGLQDAARRAMAVVHRQLPAQIGPEVSDRAAGWHTWWQCQPALPLDFPPVRWLDQPIIAGLEVADIELDLEEVRQLDHPSLPKLQRELADWLAQPQRKSPPVRSADPFLDARVALRREALTGRPYTVDPAVPRRRLAELAFEEAELLALRLRRAAARLFQRAAEAYAQAGDPVGQVMATASMAKTASESYNHEILQAAWDGLSRKYPDVAAALTALPAPGPWRYWSGLAPMLVNLLPPQAEQTHVAVAATSSGPPQLAPTSSGPPPSAPMSAGPPPAAPAQGRRRMSALSRMAWAAVVLLGTIALVVAVSKSMSASMSPPSPHASASHTSSAPASHTSSASASHTSSAPASHTSSAPASHTSSAPASHTSSAPASHTSSAPASQTSPTSSEQTSSASRVTAVILLVVLATIGTYLITGLTRGRRLADGRGLGTLRPAHLRLTATVRAEPGRTGQVRLVAEPRPLGEAPGPRLALEWPAFQLARLLRRGPPTGYTGEFEVGSAEPVLVKWANPPKARYTWWYRGTHAAAGYIQLDSTQVARPWERILAASIGPGTAGRIEWARLLATSAAPFEASEAGEVAINAPSAWQSDLEEQYQRASDFSRSFGPGGGTARLRHAMGRAVVTSAGPRLDVGGAATKAVMADKLLDAAQLVLGKPALVVLQAEPADEAIDTGLRDDAPERLALAADLIEVGAPAVLVLPALRSDEARLAIDTIAEQATDSAGCDARVLRARLRERLESNVEQTILDDVVLFINPGRNQ